MNQKRNRGHIELTETEREALRLKRSGLKTREIVSALGWNADMYGSAGSMICIAAEKERILLIEEKESRKGGVTSLARARGRNEHGV